MFSRHGAFEKSPELGRGFRATIDRETNCRKREKERYGSEKLVLSAYPKIEREHNERDREDS